MPFPKQTKDQIYYLLQEPTLDKFRDFLREQTGEHNSIDFKSKWIENASLAKEMLAMANSQGGIIVFGLAENEDKTANIKGLSEIKDKAVVSNEIKKYISSNLEYEIYDFSYDASEYEALIGKKFQILVVEDCPNFILFLSKNESGSFKQNTIYIRRGTSCETANEEEIQSIIDRRIKYVHPLNGEPLPLKEHLMQLKTLYDHIEKEHSCLTGECLKILGLTMGSFINNFGIVKKTEPNPLYPDEEYEQFISRMIIEKKKKIERVLDLY